MIPKLVSLLKLGKDLKSLKRKLSAKLYTIVLWLGIRPSEIYTLTAVALDAEWGSKRSRLWNWFPTLKEAMESAERSADWYCEAGYYTHIVIERVRYRALPYDHNPVWYELRLLPEKREVKYEEEDGTEGTSYWDEYESVRVEAPKQARNIVGWGIG